nr:hypothetical protein [Paracoccus marcusii]
MLSPNHVQSVKRQADKTLVQKVEALQQRTRKMKGVSGGSV